MIGATVEMQRVYRLARLVSRRRTAVLLTGETGTGKELVARAIHELSGRTKFAVLNCAAIPETLLEAEMFGHTRGAYTGAIQMSAGRVSAAQGGTLFLDEIGELPRSVQAKLLRFLQYGEVQRLGSAEVLCVDVRVIAATNARLPERVAAGEFREDLYYRLAVFPIEVPPLRERRPDIPLLVNHCMERLCREAVAARKRIAAEAMRLLQAYWWPGNVRELEHLVERAFILSEGCPVLLPAHFPDLGGWRGREVRFPDGGQLPIRPVGAGSSRQDQASGYGPPGDDDGTFPS